MKKSRITLGAELVTIFGALGTIAAVATFYYALQPASTVTDEKQSQQSSLPTKSAQAQQPETTKIAPQPQSKTPRTTSGGEANLLQLADKRSEFIEMADADVSAVFNNYQGRLFAKLTVSPYGKESIILPIHGAGQSLTFESKTGEYIASVLSVDFENKTLEIRVSRKN